MKAILLLLFAVLLCACANEPTLPSLPERLVLDTPTSGWVMVRASRGLDLGDLREWVPAGESLDNWSKLVSQQFVYSAPVNIEAYARENFAQRQEFCEELSVELLEADARNTLYVFSSLGCRYLPNYAEVGRLIMGEAGIHRAAYAVRQRELTEEEREDWLARLRDAYVAPGRDPD